MFTHIVCEMAGKRLDHQRFIVADCECYHFHHHVFDIRLAEAGQRGKARCSRMSEICYEMFPSVSIPLPVFQRQRRRHNRPRRLGRRPRLLCALVLDPSAHHQFGVVFCQPGVYISKKAFPGPSKRPGNAHRIFRRIQAQNIVSQNPLIDSSYNRFNASP